MAGRGNHSRGRGYSEGAIESSDLEGLRAYDAVEKAAQQAQAVGSNQSLAERKFAFEQAKAQTELEQKTRINDAREKAYDVLDKVRAEREAIHKDLTDKAELLKQTEALNKEKATAARIDAAQTFYDGAAKLNPHSATFQSDYSTLMKNLEPKLLDSDAKLPEGIKDMSAHLFTQNAAWMSKQDVPPDPLKQAQAIHGQISSLNQQQAAFEKIISDVEKTPPDWLKSTGIFQDKNTGQTMFGRTPTDGGNYVATPRDQKMFVQYQDALNQRGAIQAQLPALNAKLGQALAGNVPQVQQNQDTVGAAAAPTGTPPDADTSTGENVISTLGAASPAATVAPAAAAVVQPPPSASAYIKGLLGQ